MCVKESDRGKGWVYGLTCSDTRVCAWDRIAGYRGEWPHLRHHQRHRWPLAGLAEPTHKAEREGGGGWGCQYLIARMHDLCAKALCSVYTHNAVLAFKGVNENKHASASIETRNEKYTLTKILALPQQLRDPTSTALLPLVSSPTEPPTLCSCLSVCRQRLPPFCTDWSTPPFCTD